MESLLGHFYSRIKGSQEDIASQGIVYILNRSTKATAALVAMVNVACGVAISNLRFRAQTSGENLERPDISGYDDSNVEKIIIEAKFWAGLTANQPNEYLRRLSPHGGVLLFICPHSREGLLWQELIRLIGDGGVNYAFDRENKVARLENGTFVIIKTWDNILDQIKTALNQEDKPETRDLISDVNQIKGFCNQVDNDSFLPIKDSDMSPAIGRRMRSYYSLIDKVLGHLKGISELNIDTSGLRATAKSSGYVRYFKSGSLALFLTFNFEYWFAHAETPFWLGLTMNNTPNWAATPDLIKACNDVAHEQRTTCFEIDGYPYFPLYPRLNEIEDEVIKSFATHVEQLINNISNHLSEEPNPI